LKEKWNIAQQQNTQGNTKEKMQALSLVKERYSMKLDLLTNSIVVDDVIRFILDKSNAHMLRQ
jgi:hypothetical protein